MGDTLSFWPNDLSVNVICKSRPASVSPGA